MPRKQPRYVVDVGADADADADADGMKNLTDIDWDAWRPTDPATLLFVIRDHKILLIRKKRGLGAGKINGPGGKLEAGETPLECAIRECQEEIGIHVSAAATEYCGDNRFQFVDGYSIHVHVFRAYSFEGELVESDEATPLWFDLSQIPYDEMWDDDRYWLPMVVAGTPFSGTWIFDGDEIVDYELRVTDEAMVKPPAQKTRLSPQIA